MNAVNRAGSAYENQVTAGLQPALISSFNPLYSLASPLLDSLSDEEFFEWAWPSGVSIDVDLYLMMQNDALAWAHRFHIEPVPKTAFEFFAWIGRVHNPKFYWAQIAETAYKNALRAGSKIVATTSFFPEVNAGPGSKLGEDAPYVFASLMGIALEIAELQSVHMGFERVPTIQSVAGSVVTSFQHHVDLLLDKAGHPALHAKRDSDSRLIQNLLGNVRRALEILGRLPEGYSKKQITQIRIPWELEPGNLYVFRDYHDSLKSFEIEIGDLNKVPADVRRCMAYNLDIPHWCLCENESSDAEFAFTQSIQDRICHAHISGHSERGHFGDFSLKRITTHQQKQFKRWMKFLGSLKNCPYISLEFEAAKRMKDVRESVETLIEWLQEAET
jgi:hypothetical protein